MTKKTTDRNSRSDAGYIMATRRDQECLTWIAEQYAARGDQIRLLLSRYPDPQRPFKDKLIAETTVRDQIARWRRAGWIEYHRVLADMPGWAWVTKKGLQLVGLDERFTTAKPPAITRLDHIYAVNQVRLWMDRRYEWKSERLYRADLEVSVKKHQSTGPIPDGLITTDRGTIAIEVELSPKKPAEVVEKLARLVRHRDSHYYQLAFPRIWFYVPSESIKRLIEQARADLSDDEQKRISIAIEKFLVASRFR